MTWSAKRHCRDQLLFVIFRRIGTGESVPHLSIHYMSQTPLMLMQRWAPNGSQIGEARSWPRSRSKFGLHLNCAPSSQVCFVHDHPDGATMKVNSVRVIPRCFRSQLRSPESCSRGLLECIFSTECPEPAHTNVDRMCRSSAPYLELDYCWIVPEVPGTTGWTWIAEQPERPIASVTDWRELGGVTRTEV